MNDLTTSTYKNLSFEEFEKIIKGNFFTDLTTRLLYSTDASVYKEIPIAVCLPKDESDIIKLVLYAGENQIPLVPRTAGTSLAGQVVGHGIVVDFSKYMNKILQFNAEDSWIKVQPGVVLDELNEYIKQYGLFFGPETSTSNRCMIGGMLANNACGSHSLVYESTREHTIEIKAVLSDGSSAVFGSVSNNEFRNKCIGSGLENSIYQKTFEILSDQNLQDEIRLEYPDKQIKRRNTGYALDQLLESNLFSNKGENFNFCKLLAGSEGSLAIFTEIKLNLVALPPRHKSIICIHTGSLEEALQANLIALKYKPVAVELIDKTILECTKTNITQSKNRFFISGYPDAILVVEFAEERIEAIQEKADMMISDMQNKSLGYHYPIIKGEDINKVWALRKAGLGLLSNVSGDARPVTVIEDTAINVEHLPDFIRELKELLTKMNLKAVFHAHVGTGELHTRPVLNLKNPSDVEKFYHIAQETAILVKKYKGSLSGEHGDGRLRGEFIPIVLSENIYRIIKQIKTIWDPDNIFNPGKIIDTPSMKSFLRYEPGAPVPKIKTYFRYPESDGFIRGIEKCNGSADCRKPASISGIMCPSYHATKNEYDTTRARANILREFISNSKQRNPFNHKEIYQILDLCLSCKACKSECPSNVDMAKYKAEFLQNYYNSNRIPYRSFIVSYYNSINLIADLIPCIYNFFAQNFISSSIIKHIMGFAKQRTLPRISKQSLRKWANKNLNSLNNEKDSDNSIVIFCDEFTNYNDTSTGINTCKLLSRLGYYLIIPKHKESSRASISKGLLKKAASSTNKNIKLLFPYVEKNIPVVGIEPSAILCLRDEYKDLCDPELQNMANKLSENSFIIDEFISRELDKSLIDKELFTKNPQKIYLHSHCHQKALSSSSYTKKMLSIPVNYEVKEIECGCCGMAGSFGFEKEHYDVSMAIGELKLFPAIRKAENDSIIAASGTSCRQQIYDGTGRKALHPVDVLFDALC